jgi:hypothetical protein
MHSNMTLTMTELGSHKEDFKPKYSSSNKNEAFQVLK